MNVHAPGPVRELAQSLEQAGHETWCVGGAVRDALLGLRHLDWDLATSATPAQVIAIFGRRRTVPVGVTHGTVGVRDRTGILHEVTTFRRDVRTDGRHADVEFGVSLEDDLARRDFTINAIAFHPLREEVRDPFDGRKDLERRVVRAVGDPEARMREDRLRALRAIRFTARFEFEMDAPTWSAVAGSASSLARLSAERVQQELVKTMEQVRRPSTALRLWRSGGAFNALIAPLAEVGDDILGAVDCVGWPEATQRPELRESRTLLRLAVLFTGMEVAAVDDALRALRFSNQKADWIAGLVLRWRELATALAAAAGEGDARAATGELRRVVARAGRTRFAQVVRIANARWRASPVAGGPASRDVMSLYRRGVRIAYREPIELGDLAVSGTDLLGVGLPPGPAVGQILRFLLDAVIEDPARNTREELLTRARRLLDAS